MTQLGQNSDFIPFLCEIWLVFHVVFQCRMILSSLKWPGKCSLWDVMAFGLRVLECVGVFIYLSFRMMIDVADS